MKLQRLGRAIRILCMVAVLAGLGGVLLHQQDILDWWKLRGYQPPAAITALATSDTMTDRAQHLFYVNTPLIQDKATFYGNCANPDHASVLGCYIQNKGIYVLQVSDPRLDGVEQVTAAHEMLHAAYARLGNKQKNDINAQLQAAYATVTDAALRKKIDEYKADNADVVNELHSILGSEVANLPAGLETYYQRYFTNRKTVVAFSQKYQAEFTSRTDKLAQDDVQLKSYEKTITDNNTQLDAQSAEIKAESARLDSLRKNNDIATYNAGIAPYNQKVAAYRALAAQNQQIFTQYKQLIDARNAIAVEAQQLSIALDSRVTAHTE